MAGHRKDGSRAEGRAHGPLGLLRHRGRPARVALLEVRRERDRALPRFGRRVLRPKTDRAEHASTASQLKAMSKPDRRAAAAAIEAFLRALGRNEPDLAGTGARVAD